MKSKRITYDRKKSTNENMEANGLTKVRVSMRKWAIYQEGDDECLFEVASPSDLNDIMETAALEGLSLRDALRLMVEGY